MYDNCHPRTVSFTSSGPGGGGDEAAVGERACLGVAWAYRWERSGVGGGAWVEALV